MCSNLFGSFAEDKKHCIDNIGLAAAIWSNH